MNGNEKKNGERDDVEQWLRLLGARHKILAERERPDFIIQIGDDERIGVEHTAALHPPDSKHPGPDRSAAARAIRDAISAKAGKAQEYRQRSGLRTMWLLVVIRRREEGLELLDADECFDFRGFDRIDVLDPFNQTVVSLRPLARSA